MKFSATHNTDEDLLMIVNAVMTDIIKNQGMTITTDGYSTSKKADSMQFWPVHNFSHFEAETHLMSAPPIGTVQ